MGIRKSAEKLAEELLKRSTIDGVMWSRRECEALTQADVASYLGLPLDEYIAYEEGHMLPSVELTVKMAEWYGKSPKTWLQYRENGLKNNAKP